MHDTLFTEIAIEAIQLGLIPADAQTLAQKIVQKIPPTNSRSERDQNIRREFDGRNHSHIMRKYQISRSTLYRILNV